MPDLATLFIKVDTSDIVRAQAELEAFRQSAASVSVSAKDTSAALTGMKTGTADVAAGAAVASAALADAGSAAEAGAASFARHAAAAEAAKAGVAEAATGVASLAASTAAADTSISAIGVALAAEAAALDKSALSAANVAAETTAAGAAMARTGAAAEAGAAAFSRHAAGAETAKAGIADVAVGTATAGAAISGTASAAEAGAASFAHHAAGAEKAADGLSATSRESIRFQQHLSELVDGLATGNLSMGRLGITAERVAHGLGEGELGGIVRGLGSSIADLLSPTTIAVGGLAAMGGAAGFAAVQWADAQEKINHALLGIGQLSGITAEQINGIARAAAASGQATVGEAQQVAAALAQVGTIGAETNKLLTSSIGNISKVLGVDTVKAADQLANALKGNVAQGAIQLNERLGFLSGPLLASIEHMDALGQREQAAAVVASAIVESTKRAEEHTSALSLAWEKTKGAVSLAWAALGEGVNAVANAAAGINIDPFEKQLEDAKKKLEALIAEKEKFAQAGEAPGAGSEAVPAPDLTFWGAGTTAVRQYGDQIAITSKKVDDLTEKLTRENSELARLQANQATLAIKQLTDGVDQGGRALDIATGKLSQFEKALSNAATPSVTGSVEEDITRRIRLVDIIHNQAKESQDAGSAEVAALAKVREAYDQLGQTELGVSRIADQADRAGNTQARVDAEDKLTQAVSQYLAARRTQISVEDIATAKFNAQIQALNASTNAERLAAAAATARASVLGTAANADLVASRAQQLEQGKLDNAYQKTSDALTKAAAAIGVHTAAQRIALASQQASTAAIDAGLTPKQASALADQAGANEAAKLADAQAQVTAQVQLQIAIINARTDAQKAAAEADKAYYDAEQKGLDGMKAKADSLAISEAKLKQAQDGATTSVKNQAQDLQLQVDMFGQSQGAIEAATIKQHAFQQGLETAALDNYADHVGELRDQLNAMNKAAQGATSSVNGLNSSFSASKPSSGPFSGNLTGSISADRFGILAQQKAAAAAQAPLIAQQNDAIANAMATAQATAKYGAGNFQLIPGQSSVYGPTGQIASTAPIVLPMPGASATGAPSSSSGSGSGLFNTTSPGIGFTAQSGVDFRIPGSGGTDSQTVIGKVTPGERLTVTPAGQAAPSASSQDQRPIVQNFHIATPDTRGFYRSKAQIASAMARMMAAAR